MRTIVCHGPGTKALEDVPDPVLQDDSDAHVLGARLYSPRHGSAVDEAGARLGAARPFGADEAVDPAQEDPVATVHSVTGGLGADVALEAVGTSEAFERTAQLVRRCGHVADVGVHGGPASLHLEDLWIRDLTIRTGLVDTSTTPTLLRLPQSGALDAKRFVTHHCPTDEVLEEYERSAPAGETRALEPVVTR